MSATTLKVPKTIKMYINGAFARTESGRSFPVYKGKEIYANACLGSRKDIRASVTAANAALKGWSGRTAYNRAQILYRMAEMAEGKSDEFVQVLCDTLGMKKPEAKKVVEEAISIFIYYGGFADKYTQVIGSINPVAGPFHNFTAPEPVGVVGSIVDPKFNLLEVIDHIASVICSGNTMVMLMGQKGAAVLAPLAEVFATSDLPNGVVNLISGDIEELYEHLGTHMEVHSICYQGKEKKIHGELREFAIDNMKRVVPKANARKSLPNILNYTEFKTVWHPIGL